MFCTLLFAVSGYFFATPAFADTSTSLIKKDTSGTFKAGTNETEIIPDRTESFKTFQLPDTPDGKKQYRVGGQVGPIHYKLDDASTTEQYKEIDLTILPTPDKLWNYVMETNGYQVHFWDSLKQNNDNLLYVAEYRRDGKWLKLNPLALVWENDAGEQQVISTIQQSQDKPIIDNNAYTITWENVFGQGIDFRYNLSPDKFFKTVIVNKPEDLPKPTINPKDLKLTVVLGMSWDSTTKLGNNFAASTTIDQLPSTLQNVNTTYDEVLSNPDEFQFSDASGRDVWWLHKPKAWDGATTSQKTLEMSWQLKRQGHTVFADVSLPAETLQNKDLVYPLYIDTAIPEEQVGASTDDGFYCYRSYMGIYYFYDTSSAFMSIGTCNNGGQGYTHVVSLQRFLAVPIAKSSTITAANLLLYSYSIPASTFAVTVSANAADNAATIGTNEDLNVRARTTATVQWVDASAYAANTQVASPPDIATIIQEIVNRSGWASNNALAIITHNNNTTGNFAKINSYDSGNAAYETKLNVTYTAPSVSVPTVTTSAASSVAATSVTGNGNVTADGGATVTDRGFYYATDASSGSCTGASGGTQVTSGSGTGAYTGSIGSLTVNSYYCYHSYALNSAGTSYGSWTSFQTAPVAPSSIHIVSNNTTTTLAKSGNTVTVTATVSSGTTVTGTIGTKTTTTNTVSGTTATLTRLLDASETEGAGLDFTLVSTGAAGNSATAVTKANIADGSAVQTDFTAPAAPGNPDMTVGTDSGSSGTDNLTSNTTPSFAVSCETGATVTLYDNTTSVGTGTCSASTVTIASSALSGGIHSTMNAKQTDPAGNISVASGNLSITIDVTNPTSAISTPADNSFASSTTVSLSGTSADTNLFKTEISVDGGGYVATGGTAASWTYSATSLSQGAHTFRTQATDSAGNTGTSALVHVTVDTVAPTISIATPSDGAYKNAAFDITYTPESGTDTCAYSTNGGSSYSTPVTCSGTFSSIAPGGDADYSIKIKEIDVAGNIGYSTARTVHYDTTSPIITITNPTTSPAQSKTIAASTDSGTLTMSNTAGSTCNGTLTFVTYASQTFTSESDNTKKVCYKAVDLATNTTYSMSNAIAGIDVTNPTSAISSPSDNSFSSSTTVALSGSSFDTNLSQTQISVDGGGYVATGGTAASWTYSATGLSQGAHTFRTQATDSAGNTGLSTIVNVTVDTIAPAITVTTFPTITIANQSSVGLAGACEGSLAVTLLVSDTHPHTVTASPAPACSGGVWSASLDLHTLTDGDTITATAHQTDAAGNTGTGTKTAVKDTVAPTISIGAPSASLTKSGPITYTITYGGADAVTLADGNVTLNKISTTNGSAAISGSGTVTRTVTISSIIGDGTLGISIGAATASDTAGNTSLSAGSSATFTVDNTAPVVSITAPSDGAYKNAAFDITYTPESGTDTCAYSTNGGSSYSTPVTCSGTFSSITPGGDGDYSVKVEEIDAAGNTGYSAARTVHYDTTVPVITISNPTTAPAQSKTITASSNEGTLTMSNTAGSFCDGAHSLVFVAYASQTFTSESDNTKKVCYKAVDLATNTTYSMSDAIAGIDTTAPVISGLSDDAATTKSKTWTWSSSDGTATFRYSIDQSSGGSPSGSYSSTVTAGQSSGDGTYYIHVQAKDPAGNESAVTTVSALLDNTNPTSTISSPADNSLASSTIVALTGTSADTNLFKTEISVDGGGYTATGGTASSWTYSATGLSQGAHTFRTQATDSAGNTGLSAVVNVTVDTTAPTVSDNTPSTWQTSNFDVTLTCDDTIGGNTGCTKVYYTIDSTTPDTNSSFVNSGSGSGWQFTQVTEGDYVLKYRGLDVVGNLEDTVTAGNHLRLDKTAPTVSDDVPSGWQNSDITVTLTCDDTAGGGSGCSKVFYTLDGTDPDANSLLFVNSAGSWQFTYSTSTRDTAVLKYRGLDIAGNLEAVATSLNSLKIDKITPVISNIAPVSGANISAIGQIVTFTLDKTGDCRLATSTKSYDGMLGDTSCSVNNGIQISCVAPDFGSAGSKDLYFACADYLGNKDTAESATHVIYTVPAPAPTTQPSSGGSYRGGQTRFVLPIVPQGAPTGPFNVFINNGASVTNDRKVTLNLSAGAGATAVVISNNPDFSGAIIIPYQNSFEYDLCGGSANCLDRNYTVYTKFLNASGTDSPAVSAMINLRTSSFIGQVGDTTSQFVGEISKVVQIFQAEKEVTTNFPPINISVPKDAQVAFQLGWNLTPASMQDFVFASLPKDLQNVVLKFPQVADTLNKVGITRMNDIGQLEVAKISLPGLAESAGLSSIQGVSVPVAELSPLQIKKVPTSVVFVRAGANNLDLNVKLSIDNQGTVAQTLNTVQGRPLALAIKPDQLASGIKGYLIFKSNRIGMSTTTGKSGSLTASAINALEMNASVDVGSANTPDLVLSQFDYKDSGNGIWTADVTSPLVLGQYELRTVVNYKEKTQDPKTVSMIVVVDPEGYVYRKLGDGSEARITGASVSIYWLNSKTNQYELWPAKDFRQDNPQTTDVTGRYSFLVPPGSYYLKATAPSYSDYKSDVFKVEENKGVFMNIELMAKFSWRSLFNLQTILLGGIFIVLAYFAVIFTLRRKSRT